MKKVRILGLALFAVFAFSAFAAASAFAEGEWLEDGNKIGTAKTATTSGVLRLTDNNTLVGAATVECNGTLDGTVGPGAAGTVTKVLNSAGEEITEALAGLALSCTGIVGCEKAADVELWPEELPWSTTVELMTIAGKNVYLIHIEHYAYELLCLIAGFNIIDLCSGLTSGTLTNGVSDVLGTFGHTGDESEKGECTQGGAESGEVESIGEGLVQVAGKNLTVSE